MDESDQLWNILYEITNKSGWYQKVFDDVITQKWHQEVLDYSEEDENITSNNFWLAIQILRASAQGMEFNGKLNGCNWDSSKLCSGCVDKLKIKLEKEGHFKPDMDEDDKYDETYCYACDNEEYQKCEHTKCNCKGPDVKLGDYIVYKRRVLSGQIRSRLKRMVNKMIAEDPVDWHPWSDNQVRDIIHPSLYCYVKGVSTFADGSSYVGQVNDSEKYQWLPSDIYVGSDGSVKFQSYINNLHRKRYVKLFEETLQKFIPHFEKVIKKPLCNKYAQVIVKVGSIHLTPEKPVYKGGAWHIEGMPYEHIVATGLHYLETTNITPSFLEFRKPTIVNDEYPIMSYPQNDHDFTNKHYGLAEHWDAQMNRYLGLIKAVSGTSVVFPNSLQHHVKEFELDDKDKEGVRTIIAFFLVDPDHRIVSTMDIPEQYNTMSLDDAKKYREALMHQRKFFVDELNDKVYEREYSLCEH